MDKIEVSNAILVSQEDLAAALTHMGFDSADDAHYWATDDNELNRLDALAQAFARHRLATRTDATPVAEVAELRGNISIMEAALQQIAGTHAERFGMCQTDVEEVPDLCAEEAVSIARNALEAAGDTHPPATDVAALVEAAKETNAALERDGDPAFAHLILANKAALAPFTKG